MFICDICGRKFEARGNHPLTHTPNGFIPWNKGGGNYKPESLAKMSCSQKERFKRMPTPNKGIVHTEATKKKISEANTGRHFIVSEETKRKISRAKKGKPASEHVRKILAEARKRFLSNPILREKRARKALQALKNRPTSLEKCFMDLCQRYNLPFRYVGDGQIWVAGKNPDFININHKKQVVEILGTYWHNEEETQKRVEHYAKYGFECITIWENELKDEVRILAKFGAKE